MTERIAFVAALRMFRSAAGNSASAHVVITGEAADAIRLAALTGQWADGRRGNFGSAKVMATIGGTRWANSLFPDKESGGWAMPVRKAIREAEGLEEGALVTGTVEL